jgi:hypothetical protein
MALVKDKSLVNGFIANYFRIGNVTIDSINNYASAHVFLYKNKAARQAGQSYCEVLKYDYSGDDNPLTVAAMDAVSSNPIKLMYAKIKTHPDFADSVDD